MSNGGLGIAAQLAQSIDPQIGTPQGAATSSSPELHVFRRIHLDRGDPVMARP